MPTITFPTIANHAAVISRIGTDDVFVELSFRRLGAMVELVATRAEYNAFSGKYLRDELGREVRVSTLSGLRNTVEPSLG